MASGTPPPGQERRIHPRTPAQLPVKFGTGEELSDGVVADVSLAGVAILGEKQFPVGTEIEVHFRDRSDQQTVVRMQAIVRHSQAGRMGVQFVNVRLSDQATMVERIRRLV